MRKRFALFRITGTLIMLMILACSSVGCFAFWEGEFSPERLEKANEEDARWREWVKKYLKDVLYIRMPLDEFVKLFTKDDSWTKPERPYIISHDENKYIIIGRKGIKYRVIFEDGLLEKLEQYVPEKFPVMIMRFEEVPWYLKGEKIADGLYQGMSEDEFLRNFSHKTVSRFNNGYVILKDGRRYAIEFKEKTLVDTWFCD